MPSRAQRALPGTVAINRIGFRVRTVNVDQFEARGSYKKETMELISGYKVLALTLLEWTPPTHTADAPGQEGPKHYSQRWKDVALTGQ
ncbi:unnamed protein product [Bursaphelenchus xylophilus]|uniref:(pine wood nematode) hypothetical protein n=1 Tax=Bursaphelenchus xylophilus TaxID=6326 RepID=A0A1I7SCP7_BURXY|nr:unnamed protein product [Bursaphelenchus xylophilus]CAG9093723.1 unnamed protein product [Bursaphelenchus xylophilus]